MPGTHRTLGSFTEDLERQAWTFMTRKSGHIGDKKVLAKQLCNPGAVG